MDWLPIWIQKPIKSYTIKAYDILHVCVLQLSYTWYQHPFCRQQGVNTICTVLATIFIDESADSDADKCNTY